MSEAKINFEIEQESLANAKAYVAKHGGSLNKLVSALFAGLGQDERLGTPAIDPAARVLLDVSAGKISIMEAARLLELPDAGYGRHRLRDERLMSPTAVIRRCRWRLLILQRPWNDDRSAINAGSTGAATSCRPAARLTERRAALDAQWGFSSRVDPDQSMFRVGA